jgi:outer membrane protein assembly factor BamD
MRRSLAILSLLVAACSTQSVDETKNWPPDRLYSTAREELDAKNYTKALSYYEKIETRYPYGRFAQMAQVDTAYAHWKDGSVAQALAACDRFLKTYPDHPNADYVQYLKGRINFNDDLGWSGCISTQDMTERDPKAAQDAFDAFRELVTRFPESSYAPDARARMNYLINMLAASEVHVAEYYYRRAAYVAAVNRAQYAVINYPRAPAVERALKVMVDSYERMGMTELRDDAARMLQANFPGSQVKIAQRGAWWKFW